MRTEASDLPSDDGRFLAINCRRGITRLFVGFEDFAGNPPFSGLNSTEVSYRLDQRPPVTARFPTTTDEEDVSPPPGADISFIRDMFGHSRLYLEADGRYGRNSTTLDVTGIEGAIGPVREACNW
ncbi:MAG: hypothetical protein GDA52_06960 [Rhodobacteraceae bacterium]|nr:hypothetical protein [Paracoccaceae bacterium]